MTLVRWEHPTPPTARCETRVLTGPVPSRVDLLKRHNHLTGAEQRRLDRLFDNHPRLQVAWDALQELYGFYQADDLESALRIVGMVLPSLPNRPDPRVPQHRGHHPEWSTEILAWHHNRRSNRPLEGINNLIQTFRITANGFTNPHTALPEDSHQYDPDTAHANNPSQ